MAGSDIRTITLSVDGETIEARIRSHHLLVDVLRTECGRTSVKEGCESASCGSCTVLIDGEPTLACVTLAADVGQGDIRTAEGLSQSDEELHPLQSAFIRHQALQCGFCTPGMLMAAMALLKTNPDPDEDEIRDALGGNLCRCTGYARIIRAVADAARSMGGSAGRAIREAAQ